MRRERAWGGARRKVHGEILRLRLRMTAWERRLVNGRGVAHDARCTERFFACGSE